MRSEAKNLCLRKYANKEKAKKVKKWAKIALLTSNRKACKKACKKACNSRKPACCHSLSRKYRTKYYGAIRRQTTKITLMYIRLLGADLIK